MGERECAVYAAALVLLDCDGLLACDLQTSLALERLKRAVEAAKRRENDPQLGLFGGDG